MKNKPLHSRIVLPVELTEAEISVWNHLSASVPHLASPFLSFQYTLAVARAGQRVRVCVIYQRHDNQIVGFFPFQFKSRAMQWLKSAEPAGGQMTDYFGVIAAPGFTISPAELLSLAGLNHVCFSHLDETQCRYGLYGEQPRPGLRISCPAQNEPADANSVFSKKHSSDLKRRKKHLTDDVGPIQFIFNVKENRRELLHQLIEQKQLQYRRTGVADALAGKWKVALLEQLLETRFESCTGMLSQLTAGGHWVASHYGLAGNGILQYWLPVFNPAMAQYGPGRILIEQILLATPQQQIHTIDRGEGVTDSKKEIASVEHQFYRGIWHNNSMQAFTARSFQSLQWRIGAMKS